MTQPIVLKRGSTFLDEDELLPGEAVWDHSERYAKLGVGAGERGPRWYPGVDRFGNLLSKFGTMMRWAYPGFQKPNEIGFDSTGSFVVNINGKTYLRVSSLGAEVNGILKQSSSASQFMQSDSGLAELLFPLFTDKTLIAQFNRPAFAAIDATNKFRAYRDITNFFTDFSATFTRTQVGKPLFISINGAYISAEPNQPRIAYHAASRKCRGLLIENAGSNLITSSFDLTQWSGAGITLTQDTPGPANWLSRGLHNPFTFDSGTSSSEHSITRNFNADVTQPFAYSFFISTRSFTGNRRATAFIANSDRSHLFGLNINFTSGLAPVIDTNRLAGNGAVTSSSVEDMGGGLYRVRVAGVLNPAGASGNTALAFTFASLGDQTSNNNLSFAPAANIGYWCYIGDFQVEQSAYVSSYMPTVAAIASRGPDILSLSLQNFNFSPTEGLFEVKFRPNAIMKTTLGAVIFSLQNSDGTTRLDYYLATVNSDTSWTIGVKTYVGGTLTTANANFATVNATVADLLVNYNNLAGTLTKLVIDGSKGFIGTLSLISYE